MKNYATDMLTGFEIFCQSSPNSGKAKSYRLAIKYLCDFLNIDPNNFTDEDLIKIKACQCDIKDKTSYSYNELKQYLTTTHRPSYLLAGFISAAISLFYKYYESYVIWK